jgi:hypothetical protein
MAFSPTKWKRSTLLAAIILLGTGPLVFGYFYYRAVAKQDQRDDDLFRKYECWFPDKCVADFNGDGISDEFGGTGHELVITADRREIFRTDFDYQDGTFRTHFAVNNTSGKPTFLVYDGLNHHPPMSAAYAWDGAKLQQVSPSDLDRDILSAMAAHDDTGHWNERAFRPLLRTAQLLVYYFVFAIVLAVVLFKRYRARASRFA